MSVWVYAEVAADGTPAASALELLAKARSLGDDVAAVACGPGSSAAAATLGAYGARTVFADDREVHDEFRGEAAAHVLAQLVREHAPELLLFAATYDSRDVAGRLQGMLRTTLVANVDEILDVDRVRHVHALSLWPGRPGNLRGGVPSPKLVDVELRGPTPRLVLVRANAFDAEPCGGVAAVVGVDVPIPPARCRVRTVARHVADDSGPKLDDARVVIAGGRGLGGPDGFALLHELAAAIGDAAVGATRPVVDAGWAPYAAQIGQTGRTVRPDVYLALGISGAAQHVVGIKARCLVAVNTDPAAPIFQLADIGVVGDARALVQELVAELEAAGVR
jgi:electron transfer flavoprotein alpha subunit